MQPDARAGARSRESDVPRIIRSAIAAFALALCLAGAAQAQDYPNQPVKLVVPFPAGGGTDALARWFAKGLEAMEKAGMPLLVHGEVTDAETDIFDREAVFLDKMLAPLLKRHPGLKIVLEHITTREGVQFVEAHPGRLGGTITPHHHDSLLSCPVSVPLRVTRVADQDPAFLRFIESNGLKPGQEIEVEARDPAADSVRLRLASGSRLTVGAPPHPARAIATAIAAGTSSARSRVRGRRDNR